MLANKSVKASLALIPGKYAQEPNVVLVPAGRKTFPVGVEWTLEADESVVIGSHGVEDCHSWCVLDGDLKQIMHGSYASGGKKGPRHAHPVVARTIQGGGASNPIHIDIELTSSKLKNGASYTLIATHHGVAAAGDFVAVREPKLKAARKKRKAPAKRKKKAAAKKK